MNYIAEINAFERWLETNPLPISSQLLWYKLMNRFNRSGWSEWIRVDNLNLMADLNIRREETFIVARDPLIKAGLIEYRRGKKGCPSQYRMVSLTFKIGVETGVKSGVQTGVKSGVETGGIYKHKQKRKQNNSKENIKRKGPS